MLFTVSMDPILVYSSSLNRKVLFIFSAYPLPLICSTLMHCALTFWQDITQATGWNTARGKTKCSKQYSYKYNSWSLQNKKYPECRRDLAILHQSHIHKADLMQERSECIPSDSQQKPNYEAHCSHEEESIAQTVPEVLVRWCPIMQ